MRETVHWRMVNFPSCVQSHKKIVPHQRHTSPHPAPRTPLPDHPDHLVRPNSKYFLPIVHRLPKIGELSPQATEGLFYSCPGCLCKFPIKKFVPHQRHTFPHPAPRAPLPDHPDSKVFLPSVSFQTKILNSKRSSKKAVPLKMDCFFF